MEIKIINVLSSLKMPVVEFRCAHGDGIASWHSLAPEVGEFLDVEVDLNEVFSWKKNITLSSATSPKISVKNGMTFITAKVVPGADYECAALQLGCSIILIDIEGIRVQESDFVEAITNTISLYPTNI